MNINAGVHGLPEDVDLAINALRDAFPESILFCTSPFPYMRYDKKDSNEIVVYVTISGGDKR